MGAILVRVWRRITGGTRMEKQGSGQAMAALAEATAIQTEGVLRTFGDMERTGGVSRMIRDDEP
jgi:hypothetical protein